MGEVKIVCPSHHRADRLKTDKAVANPIVVVEESQEDEYRKHNPDVEIVTHPDSVRGISAKRQWMYEFFGDFFMMDDDISHVVYLGGDSGKAEKLTPDEVRAEIIRLHDCAEDLGIILYGFGILPNPTFYEPQQPFKLTGNINGGAFGMRPSKHLYFHPDLVVFDDMWISGLNAYYHRKILKDNRFQLVTAAMNVNPGGMAHERTTKTTRESLELLRQHFGPALKETDKSEAFLTLEVPW